MHKLTKISAVSAALFSMMVVGNTAAMAQNVPSTSTIDDCVHNAAFNTSAVIAQQPAGTANLPLTEASFDENSFTVIHREKKTMNNAESNFSAIGLRSSDIYPGAITNVDSRLVEGRPTILPLNRTNKPITISTDLPGAYDSVKTVDNVDQASVNQNINVMLDSWNTTAASKYPNQASRISYKDTLVKSQEQVTATFGYSYNFLANKLGGIDFKAIHNNQKQVYIASLDQIFYTASANAPYSASQWVNDADQNKVCGPDSTPGYISSVDYGRRIFVVAETNSKSDTFGTTISAAIKGHTPAVGVEVSEMLAQTKVTAVIFGGSSADHARIITGNVDTIRDIIANGATYSSMNPAAPISYTVKFLKDNKVATTNSVAEYYETTVETHNTGRININHKGGYIARYEVSWDEVIGFDKAGKPRVRHMTWDENNKGRTYGQSDMIVLPPNARNINVMIRERTGLVWKPWRTVVDERNMANVGERNFDIWGTTLNPKSKMTVVKEA